VPAAAICKRAAACPRPGGAGAAGGAPLAPEHLPEDKALALLQRGHTGAAAALLRALPDADSHAAYLRARARPAWRPRCLRVHGSPMPENADMLNEEGRIWGGGLRAAPPTASERAGSLGARRARTRRPQPGPAAAEARMAAWAARVRAARLGLGRKTLAGSPQSFNVRATTHALFRVSSSPAAQAERALRRAAREADEQLRKMQARAGGHADAARALGAAAGRRREPPAGAPAAALLGTCAQLDVLRALRERAAAAEQCGAAAARLVRPWRPTGRPARGS